MEFCFLPQAEVVLEHGPGSGSPDRLVLLARVAEGLARELVRGRTGSCPLHILTRSHLFGMIVIHRTIMGLTEAL